MHGEDAVGAELPRPASLVGLGGVGVAVAEDDVAGGEGGFDDLGDGLGAVGEHEGHLGEGGDGAEGGLGAGVQQDRADAIAEGRAAGLAEGDYGVAGGSEPGGEAAKLGRLAGAVETFEGDKETTRHGVSLPQGRNGHPSELRWRVPGC